MKTQIDAFVAALRAADLAPQTRQLAYGVTLVFCAIDHDDDVNEAKAIAEKMGIKPADVTAIYIDAASFATFTIA